MYAAHVPHMPYELYALNKRVCLRVCVGVSIFETIPNALDVINYSRIVEISAFGKHLLLASRHPFVPRQIERLRKTAEYL